MTDEDALYYYVEAMKNLLSSGSDKGCDGTVVVGRKEFMKLREMFYRFELELCGDVEEDDYV
jgi:hypothetical protein